MSLCIFVKSVLLCSSVRNRTSFRVAGEFFLSRRIFLSLTERTEFTDVFGAQFRAHRRPPAYREHRGLTPNPSPNGEGSSMWGYPFWPADRRRIHTNHTEDKQGYLGDYSPLHSERGRGWGSRMLIIQTEGVKIFHHPFLSWFKNAPDKKQEYALLRSRTRLSCAKKSVFNEQEGHVLKC